MLTPSTNLVSLDFNPFWDRLIPIGFFGILILPYLILGESVSIPVTDNLDSNLAWWKAMQDSETLFSSWEQPVPGMLIENPRFAFPSVWSVEGMVYAIFPVFWGYVFLKGCIFFIGYYSFRFWIGLQSKLGIPAFYKSFLPLIWASLAFYIHRGIGIAALPCVVGIFQEFFRGKNNLQFYLILMGYGFFSKLTLTGIYVWIGLFAWMIWVGVKQKRMLIHPLKALLILLLIWIIQEHQLLRGLFFNPDFQSHREDFSYDFGIWADQMPWNYFLNGDRVAVFYSPVYLILIFFFGWMAEKNTPAFLLGVQTALIGIIGSVLLSILSFSEFTSWFGGISKVLSSLNFNRFGYWIYFLLFATLICWWSAANFRFSKLLIPVLLGLNVFVYQYEWRYWINSYFDILPQRVPTFQEYYARDQWKSIREILENETNNPSVVHFNIPPAVSAFNGLKSLDGYLQIYPREKKYQVYRVVTAELDKDPSLKDHLLKWGNKCYFQNAQYPDDYVMYSWRNEAPLLEPEFDFQYLRDSLGATHVLSALPVLTNHLRFVKKFEDESSAWNVYLYSLD